MLLFWWYNWVIDSNSDSDFTDTLLDEKSDETYENILFYSISYKTSTGENHCVLGSIK